MRKLFILPIIYFLVSATLYSQSTSPDTTSMKVKYSIGARYSMLHLAGNAKGNIEFGQSPDRILISKTGGYDPGIFISTESRYRRRENLYRQIEIGVTTMSGEIEYKEVGGSSINVNGKLYEQQRYKDFEFREIHLYTNYQVKTFVKNLFSISIGSQISGRIRKKIINGIGESSLYGSDLSPEQNEEYKNSFEVDSDDNGVIAQISLLTEIGKPFNFKESHFSTGIKYNQGLINFHNAGNTKTSTLSFYLKYYL